MTRTTSTAHCLPRLPGTLLLTTTVAVVSLLSACGKDDGRTAGQKLDAAVAQTEAKTDSIARTVEAKTDSMTRTAEAKLDNATTRVAAAVEDAKITAAVNAKLAEDTALSALKINVDTTAGKVSLRGTAPDAVSRDRATQLAQAVQGVVSVDNQLQVRS